MTHYEWRIRQDDMVVASGRCNDRLTALQTRLDHVGDVNEMVCEMRAGGKWQEQPL